MRKMTNSMWIRRVSPLTLAGALVLPLAVQSADVAQKAAVPSAAQKVTEKGKQDKQEFIDRCEKERMAALNLAAEGDYNNAVVRLECERALDINTAIALQTAEVASKFGADLFDDVFNVIVGHINLLSHLLRLLP